MDSASGTYSLPDESMKSCWVSTSQKISREATSSPARALLPLEQKRTILETGALGIGHGEPASGVDAGRAVRSVLRDRVEIEIEPRAASIIEQPSLRHRYHALQRL